MEIVKEYPQYFIKINRTGNYVKVEIKPKYCFDPTINIKISIESVHMNYNFVHIGKDIKDNNGCWSKSEGNLSDRVFISISQLIYEEINEYVLPTKKTKWQILKEKLLKKIMNKG